MPKAAPRPRWEDDPLDSDEAVDIMEAVQGGMLDSDGSGFDLETLSETRDSLLGVLRHLSDRDQRVIGSALAEAWDLAATLAPVHDPGRIPAGRRKPSG